MMDDFDWPEYARQAIAEERQNAARSMPSAPKAFAAGRKDQLTASLRFLHQITPQLSNLTLVKGWLGTGGLSAVYGASNVGKTFWAVDLAFHVAGSDEWHGTRIRGGLVVYIAAEGGVMINNRIEAFRLDRPSIAGDAERNGRFALMSTTVDLCTSDDAQQIIGILQGLTEPPALVVVDTLARSMGSGDENLTKDMGNFVRNCDAIRAATGAHVMVIHHTGKDESRGMRGAYALFGAVDTVIEISRSGDVMTATQEKQRDMPLGPSFSYRLRDIHLGEDEDGAPITSAVIDATDAPARKKRAITGQAAIAMQAFGDALAHHGETRSGDMFPANRQCVSLERWREYCDRHELSGGETATARRTAFHKAKTKLQEEGVIRIVDGYAWRVAE